MALGAALPVLTWTYNGFVNGDNASSTGLQAQVTTSTTATGSSLEGLYPIWVSGPAETTNYRAVYVPGTLTIVFVVPPALAIDLSDCVRLNVGTVTPLANPQPGEPVATGSNVELEFLQSSGVPKFTFGTVDLYRDDGSTTINGFVLPIPAHAEPGTIGVGTGIGNDFLEFQNSTVAAGKLSKRHGVVSGELSLTADTATLFPKATRYGGTISNGGQGGPGLTARYVAAEDRWVFDAKELTVTVNSVFQAVARNAQLIYPVCGSAQPLALVPNVTLTLTALGNTVITGRTLTLRPDGFSLSSAETVVGDFTMGGFLSVTNATVRMTDLNYTAGSAPTGTLRFETNRADLFPGTGFAAALTDGPDPDALAVVGSFNLEQKVFSLAVDQLALTVPKVMTALAEGITLTYAVDGAADQSLVLVPIATLKPFAPDQSPVTVQNLVLRQNGFRWAI